MSDDADTRKLDARKPAPSVPRIVEPSPVPGPRYEIGDEIARGGMGRVVEATDSMLGRQVAVKEALASDRASLQRFVRETRVTARLEHPAIVPVYDAGVSADGTPFYVMRKVSGEPLENLVGKAATVGERLGLVAHVVAAAHAVAHAHARGVIHRDLKPANILVGEFGEAIVIDWGLAKVTGEPDDAPSTAREPRAIDVETEAGSVFGTPGFMSPEQVAGTVVDPRSDVYALGATLFFVLASRPPHRGRSGEEMMAAAAAGPPPRIQSVVPGVPRDLAWIVDKALAFDLELRYAHAGELAADLQRFMTGQLVASRHYTRRERLVRLIARHRVAAVVIALAVITLTVAVARVFEERRNTEAALETALEEKQHADEATLAMTLNNARSLLATDPTAAVALVKPLASTSHWREVRAIAAQAHMSGACWGIPGPLDPSLLVFAPDGVHLATAAIGGGVWLHDLARRTSRELLQLAPRQTRVTFADDTHLIAYDAHHIVVIDVATGGRRDLAYPRELDDATATQRAVFVVSNGDVERIDLGTGAIAKLDITRATAIVASPDRKWLAIATADGLVVIDSSGDRTGGPSGAPVRVGTGDTRALVWDGSSRSIAAIQGEDIVLVSVDPAPAIASRRPRAGVTAFAPASGKLFVEAHGALERAGESQPILIGFPHDFGIAFTRGGVPLVGMRSGLLTFAYEPTIVSLHAPSTNLVRLAASPASDYVVGATQGRLFLWDVRVMPKQIAIERTSAVSPAGGHELVLGDMYGSWRWFDVDTRAAIRFQAPFGLYAPFPSPRGSLVALVPDPRSPAQQVILAERAPVRTSVIGGQPAAVLVADDLFIAGMSNGRVIDVDPKTSATTLVIEHPGSVIGLARDGEWRGARWRDGTLWRRGPDGVDRFAKLEAGDDGNLMFGADGHLWTFAGARVVAWTRDGLIATIATLPSAIAALVVVDDAAVVALTDQTMYRVALTSGHVDSLPLIGGITSFAPEAGLVVTTQPDGRVNVIDVVANATWQLAAATAPMTSGASISPDGRRVSLVVSPSRLLVWTLDLPVGPLATSQFVEALTNATAEHGSGRVVWH